MSNKVFWLKFGSGDPALNTGLTPTFTLFYANGLTALSAPGITELPLASGLYQFQYYPTLPIVFKADGGANLSAGDRFISATLDPIQAVDQQLGYVTDSYGSTMTDPSTMWGMLKRVQEWLEGDAVYIKSTGIWKIFSRGSTTQLRQKSMTNNTTQATKSGL